MKKFLKVSYIVFFILALLSSKASAVPTFVDSFSVSSQEAKPRGFTFNNDGTKMFVAGFKGDDINEYTLSTGFDLTSTVTFVDSFSVRSEETEPSSLVFSSDGV